MREEEMSCKDVCELLTAYLDGEVTPDEKAYIEAHLPACPQCHAELEALSATQASLREALKSVADEASPSPGVWEKVRNQLETRETRRGFWSSFTLRRVVTAAAAVFILIIAVVIWQHSGIFEAGSPPPATTIAAPTTTTATSTPSPTIPGPFIVLPSIEFQRLSPTVHMSGEEINLNLSFSNTASESNIMSPFPPQINIVRPNAPSYEDIVRSLTAGTQERQLGPDETVTYPLTWDQRDNNGQQVTPGWYAIEITVNSHAPLEATNNSIRGWVTKVLILPPQGVMEKTIDVNQSQTVTGLPFTWGQEEQKITVTITLEQVEMTADNVKFTVLVTSPAYSLPQGPDLAPPQWMLAGYAQYTVDGVTKDAGVASMRPLENGVQLEWGYEPENIDPIPSDAKELTFTITKIGEWEGPWEFHIPLK